MNFDDRRVRLAMLVLAILAVIAAPTWLLFYQYFTADLFRELPDFLREVPANVPCVDTFTGYTIQHYSSGGTVYSPNLSVSSTLPACKMELAIDWQDAAPLMVLSTFLAGLVYLLLGGLYRGVVWVIWGNGYPSCQDENCSCVDCPNHPTPSQTSESESEAEPVLAHTGTDQTRSWTPPS